jgi:Flp pilus assembly protein TadD
MARAAAQGGRRDLAINELVALSKDSPTDAEALIQLAQVYIEIREASKALDTLSRVHDLMPGRPEPVALRAMAMQQAGRTEEAEAEFRSVLKLAPNDPMLRNNFAFFLAEHDRHLDEALLHAQEAVQKRPDVPQFIDTLGWIYLKKNAPDKALEHFRELVRNYPDNAQFRYHLGITLVRSGDRAGGRAQLAAALRANPSAAEVLEIRSALEGLAR